MAGRKRIPPIDASLVIVISLLQLWRNDKGMEFCHDLLIGGLRRMLGAIAEDPATFGGKRVEVVRDQARQSLAGVCEACTFRDCPMKRWGLN